MSEPKLISPLLDGFLMGDPISSHHGVRCCPAMREATEEKYIVKIISIPASRTQLDALLLTGAYQNQESANAYFQQLSHDVEEEAQILKDLSQLEGFDAYENWQVVPMEDGTGFDVYLLSRYKRSLDRMLRHQPMTHLAAVNLGLDLCAALSVCRRSGYLYVDLKPENIFVSSDRVFHIGDLGFVSQASLKYASLPEKYRSCWTAPEISDAFSTISETADVYALGLILYQIYNGGQLPDQTQPGYFPPPVYADYEIAEIILRACAPVQKDRWQTPLQMGQALVAYLQRNSINDDPIVPPPAPVERPSEEEPAAEAEEPSPASPAEEDTTVQGAEASASPEPDENASEDAQMSLDEILTDAQAGAEEAEDSHLLSDAEEDETLPNAEMAEEMTEDGLTEEVSQMLAQANELISHEAPPPVVAPDPIEIPMPEPIPIVKEVPETAQEGSAESSEEAPEPEDQDDEEELNAPESAGRRKRRSLLVPVLSLITVVLLAAGAIVFYQHYYLQEIKLLQYVCERDTLTVTLDTEIPDEKLTVILTDTYGNTKRQSVSGGSAHFTELSSGTDYKISVQISGFHKLTGDYSAVVTTDQQTKIVTFSAITGAEDGSVLLNFTVDGPETQEWKVLYSAPGEPEREISFTGHMVSITGLTVGAEYTFHLVPGTDLYVTGNDTLTYTASKVILARDMKITDYDFTALTVVWQQPEGSNVENWSVRCYNENGYDKTVTVSEPAASFDGLDSTTAYTIEVTAAGMAQNTRLYVSANPVSITELKANTDTAGTLKLEWTFKGNAPEGGWLVLYNIDGSEMQSVVKSNEPNATIPNAIPGAVYTISIQAANGTGVFGGSTEVTTPEAPHFNSFKLKDTDLNFKMCNTPADANWDRFDLKNEDYTTQFAVGTKASFLVKALKNYGNNKEPVTILYVIRDAEGTFVSSNVQQQQWNKMFNKYYCELDIPVMPASAGAYNIQIFFNYAFVASQDFTVQ